MDHLIDVGFRSRNIIDNHLEGIRNFRQNIDLVNQALWFLHSPYILLQLGTDRSGHTRSDGRALPFVEDLIRLLVARVRVVFGREMCGLGHNSALRRNRALGSHRRELVTDDDRSNIDCRKARSRALLSVCVGGGELHHDGGYAPELVALEVSKVPSRGDEVWSHSLDCMHEHAMACQGQSLAVADNSARRNESWPESMDHISVGLVGIVTEIREAALGTTANLPSRNRRRSFKFESQLKIGTKICGDKVHLWEIGPWLRLECH